ncbi:hypothetical protein RYX36_023326 [Vicia faba]
MRKEGFKSNGVSFTTALVARSHAGLIEKIHEGVVSLIPTTDFLFGNWPMNIPLILQHEIHIYSFVILAAKSLMSMYCEVCYYWLRLLIYGALALTLEDDCDITPTITESSAIFIEGSMVAERIDRVPRDILIGGVPAQNRIVEGDVVANKINPLSWWTK